MSTTPPVPPAARSGLDPDWPSEWGEVLLAMFDAIVDRHDDLTLPDVVARAKVVGLDGDQMWCDHIGPLVDELQDRLFGERDLASDL